MEPNRGTTVLVLGILGIVLCPICGIIAWVMGNKDIPKMEAGTMDPEGLGATKAGKICGIIAVVLMILGVVAWIAFVALFGGLAAMSGGLEGLEGFEAMPQAQ